MSPVAPPPAGSLIEIRTLPEGLELRMPRPHGFARWFPLAFLGGWLSLATVLGSFAAFKLASLLLGGELPDRWPLVVFLSIWLTLITIGGFPLLKNVPVLIAARPERIAITRDALDFDLGSNSYSVHCSPPSNLAGRAWTGDSLAEGSWPRGEVGRIEIVVTQYGRLVAVERGRSRALFGWKIGEPEREWLCNLLLAWKATRLGL